MEIQIRKPGILATIQDFGRMHFLCDAVPVSGAMDSFAARIANKAVGNSDNEGVIEFTYFDVEFVAITELLISYSGCGNNLLANNYEIPAERPVYLPAGTSVKLLNSKPGSRTYVAIAGGWNVPDVLGSKSTCLQAGFGGLEGRGLKTGDIMGSGPLNELSRKIFNFLKGGDIKFPGWSLSRLSPVPGNPAELRVVRGHEFNWFDSRSVVDFLSAPYKIDNRSNRMAYHLNGARVWATSETQLISTAVMPGTIQVTGGGGLLLLMVDCQTTGGYPRIAQVAAIDLPVCGQLKPGDSIVFKEISLAEAEALYLETERQLEKMSLAIKMKFI